MAGQHYTENTAIITQNVEFDLYNDHHPSLNIKTTIFVIARDSLSVLDFDHYLLGIAHSYSI